jgi:hypothetical protein
MTDASLQALPTRARIARTTRSLYALEMVRLCLFVLLCGCSRVPDGYCRAANNCDDPADGVGESDDSIAVCIELEEGFLRSLRKNDEQECLAAADAYEAYLVCAATDFDANQDGCSAIGEACANERRDFNRGNPLTTGRDTCTEFQE